MTNTIQLGDNLEIMRSMESGCIDLIATDPPFNTGKDWGAFNDKWEGGMKGYLKFMEPRLVEMHRLLKDTGSLYLHCDPHASHYLKVMMDGIFGMKHFRNEIVWKRSKATANDALRRFAQSADSILFYTKSNDYVFNLTYKPLANCTIEGYSKTDNDGRRYDTSRGGTWGGTRQPSGKRLYLDERPGVPLDICWMTDTQLGTSSKERVNYPTQKPVALLERIIKASSNQGDVVFDPFCGSGTTLRAAKTLDRKYIGIDQNPEAIRISENRLNPPQQELFTA